MRLNSKVTMGLAWTGLAVVLAVPSADYLTSAFGNGDKAAVLTSDIEQAVTAKVPQTSAAKPELKPTETAAIAPTVTTTKTSNGVIITPAGSSLPQDPVDKFLQSGKPLPDYISGTNATTTPAKPVLTAPAAETQVAAIDPKVPPTPFPAWARPAFMPAPVKAIPVAPAVTAAPVVEPVVIIDETTQTGSIAVPTGPVPPSAIVDDTQNWETESLRDYLERRGILEGGSERSSATVTQRSNDYDADGFYLSDGPNGDRETRRQRILRLLEESDSDPNGLTLF
ncbi:MAG: hypothetical protein EOP22_15685 [Hyphomicrobiales bacterium]|nr:MAG: hypothetical protein EOP22_15685 [Hyphomicrobiales bacterium]